MRFIFRFRGFFLVLDLLVSAMLVSNWNLRNGDLPKCSLCMNASLSQKRAPEVGVTPTLTTCPANLPRRPRRAVVIAEALSEGRIRERFFADAITRRILQPLPLQIDDIALEPSVVGLHLPRQEDDSFRQALGSPRTT